MGKYIKNRSTQGKIALVLFLLLTLCSSVQAQRIVKVGAFNFYPGIFMDEDGEIKGSFVDALSDIGKRENIKFVYIYGSWNDGLNRMRNGELDMLTSVAYTEERTTYLKYTSIPLVTVWGEVYVHQDSEVQGILDLHDKTIAIMQSDMNGKNLQELTNKLSIPCTYIEVSDFEKVFQYIDSGKADAGVVNNTFGAPKSHEFSLRSSGIVFNPFDIFFTVNATGNDELLQLLNNYLQQWQHDRNSVLNVARQKWSHGDVGSIIVVPKWIKTVSTIALIVVVVLILFIILLRYQVNKATHKVKQSEALFKSFMQNTPAFVYIKDEKLNHIYRNKMVNHLVPNALKNEPSSAKTFFTPEVANFVEQIDRQILRKEKLQADIQYSCTINGQNIWLHDYKFSLQMPDEKHAIGGISFNISQLKETELELIKAKEKAEESEGKYRKMVENMNSGVAIYLPVNNGKDFIITDFNRAAEKITNSSVNDVKDHTLLSKFPNMDKSPLFMALQQVYKSGINLHVPPFFYKDNQREGWRENYIYKLPSGEIVAIFDDVTERRSAEINLQNQNNELVIAKEKAEESDRMKTAFLQNLSHEIRTPMNSIMGFASLLPEEENKDLISQYSEIIYKNSEQLVHVIDDIVLYSQLQNKQFTFIPKEFDANNLILDIKQSFNLPEYQQAVQLKTETPENSSITVFSDYEKIRQVLTNLISNAFKYTNKGSITFGLSTHGKDLLFFVKDTGIGIPKSQSDKIFDRFYRASNVDKSAISGTGLGLSIVNELIELLGGKIWVESEVNLGSTFYFTLPY